MTTPADELRAAVGKLRQARFPAAMTATASTAALISARLPLADWLELEADVIAAREAQPEGGEYAVDIGGDHALAVARAINGSSR